MRYIATIQVMLKRIVLDPQGEAVRKSLAAMGYTGVHAVRVGKHLELVVDAPGRDEAARVVEEMCHRLLSNPVIEEYSFTLEGGETGR